MSQLPAIARGVVSQAGHAEFAARIHAAIDALDPIDRQIVILRGIEQVPGLEVAEQLALTPNAVSLRYRRALARLRERLPGSPFDELDGPDAA